MPDLNKTGQKRVFPKLVTYRQLDTREFLDMMYNHNHAISQSAATAVLKDVADYLAEVLSEGYSVKLDGIGHFSLSLDFDDSKPCNMSSDDDKMTRRKVRVKEVNYYADPELTAYLNANTTLTRDSEGVSQLKKQLYSPEQRIERAQQWLDTHHAMTLNDYAEMNNMSRTSASRELAKLSTGSDAPFACTGKWSHKVWVKRE